MGVIAWLLDRRRVDELLDVDDDQDVEDLVDELAGYA